MPYRKEQFETGYIYHITLKGLDSSIFKDLNDYYRGIFSIYEFNNSGSVTIQKRRETRTRFKEGRGRTSTFIDERDKLVEVLCFCFMPNHIHLLVRQLKDNGITEFMRKIGTGYGGYFNRKYNRQGHVFQNRFNAVHIENEEQLKIVFAYIYTNPLSLIYPEWKEIRIENLDKAAKFLENYKWSSYLDCIGIKNFPSVTEREFIVELIGGEQKCKDFIKYWIEYKGESKEYSNLFLE
ncbi:transposase [Patescibacteria group bacterium]|nr:transposase [Patescibacteria group bacterium]